MPVMQAGSVVAQHLDNPAFGDAAVLAFIDHALHFGTERRQLGDLLVDLCQVAARDYIDIGAGTVRLVGERQQLADRLDFKPQVTRMP